MQGRAGRSFKWTQKYLHRKVAENLGFQNATDRAAAGYGGGVGWDQNVWAGGEGQAQEVSGGRWCSVVCQNRQGLPGSTAGACTNSVNCQRSIMPADHPGQVSRNAGQEESEREIERRGRMRRENVLSVGTRCRQQ